MQKGRYILTLFDTFLLGAKVLLVVDNMPFYFNYGMFISLFVQIIVVLKCSRLIIIFLNLENECIMFNSITDVIALKLLDGNCFHHQIIFTVIIIKLL